MPHAITRHLHNKKIKNKKQKPKEDELREMLDKIIYLVCIVAPILALPQVWKIFSEKNAGGVSLITYGGFVIINIIWVMYGMVHKEKPVVLLYSSLFVVNLLVVIGRILYG